MLIGFSITGYSKSDYLQGSVRPIAFGRRLAVDLRPATRPTIASRKSSQRKHLSINQFGQKKSICAQRATLSAYLERAVLTLSKLLLYTEGCCVSTAEIAVLAHFPDYDFASWHNFCLMEGDHVLVDGDMSGSLRGRDLDGLRTCGAGG
jgi:hypothetical protein